MLKYGYFANGFASLPVQHAALYSLNLNLYLVRIEIQLILTYLMDQKGKGAFVAIEGE